MRDVKKNIAEGKHIIRRHEGLMLKLGEMRDLIELSKNEENPDNFILDLMTNAYNMGLAVGRRNAPKKRA